MSENTTTTNGVIIKVVAQRLQQRIRELALETLRRRQLTAF
jgi:hypothetical protein